MTSRLPITSRTLLNFKFDRCSFSRKVRKFFNRLVSSKPLDENSLSRSNSRFVKACCHSERMSKNSFQSAGVIVSVRIASPSRSNCLVDCSTHRCVRPRTQMENGSLRLIRVKIWLSQQKFLCMAIQKLRQFGRYLLTSYTKTASTILFC